jgi:FlaA1/EpsC-like NDP-sugar epimerase
MQKGLYSFVAGVRNRHLFALDVLIISLAPLAALVMRFEGFDEVPILAPQLAFYTAMALTLKLSVFYGTDFYARYWRYASVDEIAVLGNTLLTTWILCVLGFFAFLTPLGLVHPGFPRSLPFLDGILTMLLVGGVRFALRLIYVLNQRDQSMVSNRNALIVGAGITGSMIVKELRDNPQRGINPVCYVDDSRAKIGKVIHGVKVVGALVEIPQLLGKYRIDEVIIAMPTAPGKVIRDVAQICKEHKIVSKTIPSVFEILSGSAVAQLREIKIEDLLRRGVIAIEEKDVADLISGGRVMVTGAGGSIGSELCRQIVSFRPKELVLLGHGENSIFQIAAELRSRHGLISESVRIHTVIADIRDEHRMESVFDLYRPEIIFHAAAHKHVGLMEKNASDAVTNNIEGTKCLVDLAEKYEVTRLVMISSDKAVNPACIMGVTKRIAELVVHDAAERTGRNFVVVRFGNVLGSRGSVVPILRQQIQEGGPVKITHPDVTRFFMTIPEAVQLVLQAGTMGKGGELFVLDMGEPIKILDLAKDLIRLSGSRDEIGIEIVGLQKGEKLHEELFYETERPERSAHEKIFVCRDGHQTSASYVASYRLLQNVESLIAAAHAGDLNLLGHLLTQIVPQFGDEEFLNAECASLKPRSANVIPIQKELFETPLPENSGRVAESL